MSKQWCVYVIGRPGETKVGMTNNLAKRQMQIQNGNAAPLTLHAFFPVAHKEAALHVECWAHYLLLPFHGVGEWFIVPDRKALSVVEYVLRRDYELSGDGWINRTGDYRDPERVLRTEVGRKMWQDLAYRKRATDARRKRWQDPAYRAKAMATLQALHTNPESCAKRLAGLRSPESKAKMSEASRRMWNNPNSRAKILARRKETA